MTTVGLIKGVRVLKRQGRGEGVLIGKCQIRQLSSVANGVLLSLQVSGRLLCVA